MVLPTTATTGLCQKGDTLKSVVVPGLFDSLEHGVLAKLDSVLGETTMLMATLNNELSEGSLYQTLQNVEQISYDLRVSGNDLRKLTHNQLPGIIAKVDSTVTSISALANEVEQVDIAGLVDSINTVVGGVNQAIQSHEGTIGLLLNDKALYDNLNTTLINLDNVVLGVDSIVTSIKARAFIQKKLPK
jgi:phospholipid/cholesterol/gamma-HCH transport system substrate-binding protein